MSTSWSTSSQPDFARAFGRRKAARNRHVSDILKLFCEYKKRNLGSGPGGVIFYSFFSRGAKCSKSQIANRQWSQIAEPKSQEYPPNRCQKRFNSQLKSRDLWFEAFFKSQQNRNAEPFKSQSHQIARFGALSWGEFRGSGFFDPCSWPGVSQLSPDKTITDTNRKASPGDGALRSGHSINKHHLTESSTKCHINESRI